MTSSLPNFSAPSAVPTTSVAQANSANRPDPDAEASNAPAGDFADLMPETEAAIACPATATSMPSFTILAPTSFTLLASSTAQATAAAADVSSDLAVEGADDATAPATGEVSRDAMEQAASFMATILQALLPEVVAPIVAQAGGNSLPVVSSGSANTAAMVAAQPELGSPKMGTQAEEGAAPAVPSATPAANPENSPSAFEISLAADGTVEIKAALSPEQGSDEKSASNAPAGGTVGIQAELALPGQAVVRLTATGTGDFTGRANFAGKIAVEKTGSVSRGAGTERKFLTAGDKQFKARSSAAGITVAKTDSTMNSAPLVETRAASLSDFNPGPVARGEFTVAWPSTMRTDEASVAPLEKNFAERAVATVTNLVDTQFTASMQKAGSVQLRLKFGGEDLSVRVELRGGEVHTDFRTDSPELQAALNREWQAVAASSPDQLRQFAQPVFSPSSSHGDSSSSFAGRQQQQQQAAQQDLAQQRAPRSTAEDPTTFTRRSLVSENFSSAVAPRSPAFLPTSQRLSVLA